MLGPRHEPGHRQVVGYGKARLDWLVARRHHRAAVPARPPEGASTGATIRPATAQASPKARPTAAGLDSPADSRTRRMVTIISSDTARPYPACSGASPPARSRTTPSSAGPPKPPISAAANSRPAPRPEVAGADAGLLHQQQHHQRQDRRARHRDHPGRRQQRSGAQHHHAGQAECRCQQQHRQGHAPGAGARQSRYDEGGQQPAQRADGGPSPGGGQVETGFLQVGRLPRVQSVVHHEGAQRQHQQQAHVALAQQHQPPSRAPALAGAGRAPTPPGAGESR